MVKYIKSSLYTDALALILIYYLRTLGLNIKGKTLILKHCILTFLADLYLTRTHFHRVFHIHPSIAVKHLLHCVIEWYAVQPRILAANALITAPRGELLCALRVCFIFFLCLYTDFWLDIDTWINFCLTPFVNFTLRCFDIGRFFK